jgi:CRISPR system Cascade subunit CasE
MSLSFYQLRLNLTDRAVRRDLGNAYDMHRTLSRLFHDIDHGVLHPFLWRLEPCKYDDPPVILIQSASQALWTQLPSGYMLSYNQRSWDPASVLRSGRRVLFRLRANPTVHRVPKVNGIAVTTEQSARGCRKRLGLWSETEQLEWLQRQAQRVGLASVEAAVSHSERLRCRKRDVFITVASAQFDGRAVIADPDLLVAGLCTGIGHARMLGHGLLTLAPMRS